ncbi:MAG TPA: replication initiator protein A [bacterium]|nr:replication initiator protein A [bacterium]HQO33012.1 replication initiator protein A [bacterium]HQP97842.1 replication initiator protein A [bacterium]
MTKKRQIKKHTSELFPQILRGIVGVDPNLNRRPIFVPDKRARKKDLIYIYEKEENHNGRMEKIVWKVSANPEYGTPTVLDQDVLFALYKLLNNKGFERINEKEWLGVSCYEIIRVLGRNDSGKNFRDVQACLRRLLSITIEATLSFFHKESGRWMGEMGEGFHLIDRIIWRGDPLPNGETAYRNYILFGSLLLDNIRVGYLAPLDLDFYYSLPNPTDRALYPYLAFCFHAFGQSPGCFQIKYSTLCRELRLTKHRYFSSGIVRLKDVFLRLEERDFLRKGSTEFLSHPTDKGEGYIHCLPGERILHPDRYNLRYRRRQTWQPLLYESDSKDNHEIYSIISLFYKYLGVESPVESPHPRDLLAAERLSRKMPYLQDLEVFVSYTKERWPSVSTLSGAVDKYLDVFLGDQTIQKRLHACRQWDMFPKLPEDSQN